MTSIDFFTSSSFFFLLCFCVALSLLSRVVPSSGRAEQLVTVEQMVTMVTLFLRERGGRRTLLFYPIRRTFYRPARPSFLLLSSWPER